MTDRRTGSVGVNVDLNDLNPPDRRSGFVGVNVDLTDLNPPDRRSGFVGATVDLKIVLSATVTTSQATAVALTATYLPGTITYPITRTAAQTTSVSLQTTLITGSITYPLAGSVTQTQAVRLARSTTLARTVQTSQSVTVGRTKRLTLAAATVAQTVSLGLGRGYQRIVTTTQTQAVSLRKTFFVVVRVTGNRRVSMSVSLGRQLARLLRATVITQPRLVRRITLTRALTVGESVSLSGLPVKLQGATVVQTRSMALGRFISLVRTIAQPTLAWMPSGLGVVRTLVQPTLLERGQAIRLTRSLTQPQAVSVVAQNVTPRSVLVLTTSVSQVVSLSQAQSGTSARTFAVVARPLGDFAVGDRAGPFAVRRRGVRFTVER